MFTFTPTTVPRPGNTKLTSWLKQFLRPIVWAVSATPLFCAAQAPASLTLEEANRLARANYPLLQQQELARLSSILSSSILEKGFLPQLGLNGQATYQSDVTNVTIPFPGMTIPMPDKDQYKITADVSQLLYDGGAIRSQQQLQAINADVEKQQVEVELYKVRDRVNQLYLGILLLDAQLKQATLTQDDLRTGIRKTEAQVANGVTFRSNLDVLNAQLLVSQQRRDELAANRKGLTDALSILTGTDTGRATLALPDQPAATVVGINRPEIALFDRQSAYLEQQKKGILARNLPKASLFGQGGYGRPGLNMLDNTFDRFYIAGVRLNWSLGGLYTFKKEKQQIDIGKRTIDLQQETFVLNTSAQLAQQRAEIEKLEKLIAADREIITLRQRIKKAANAQLENQVITANDYLREVNAEDQANQSLILHELQLIQARLTYRTIQGN